MDSQTLNYTPVAVGIVALWAFGSWFLWARRWFTGPIRQIEEEALGVPIGDPAMTVKMEEELGIGRKEIDVDDKSVGKSW